MSSLSARAAALSPESARTGIRDSEQSFGSILGDIARLLWPQKTAANLAVVCKCSERAAEMYLAGHRDWSGGAVAIIVAEVLRRHGLRNVRVVEKQ